ncbi:putative Nodulation protein S (NodS)propane synthetase [Trypanosoma vivax]|nr:3-demethylubiquinone-9 3-methyltransferase [Trypanosoma vivax]KAH8604269.1 putative Nodulation protein S (NodS)propane synthetase [Trypanosoma vivax]
MPGSASSYVSAHEIAKFSRLQQHWWNPRGSFGTLHMFNPLRIEFIRSVCKRSHGLPGVAKVGGMVPGASVLDVGCGGGILSESLARLGGNVLGIDMCEESLKVAGDRRGLVLRSAPPLAALTYRCASLHTVVEEEKQQFDIVIASEVIEHVDDAASFLEDLCTATKPGGVLVISTLDKSWRTALSHIVVAEYLTHVVEPGTHDWAKFIPPNDIARFALQHRVRQVDLQYILPCPDLLATVVASQLQLTFSLTNTVNTGHYFWAGVKLSAVGEAGADTQA